MIDIGKKEATEREAVVEGDVSLNPEVILAIKNKKVPKGDVLEAARLIIIGVIVAIAISISGYLIIRLFAQPAAEKELSGIEEVKARYASLLMDIPGVVGVGIGRCDGEPCIKVLLEKETEESKRIPRELQGFVVDIEVTGPIEALPLIEAQPPDIKTEILGKRKVVTIKNSTFYLDDVPVFFIGPFMGQSIDDVKTPRPGIKPDHPLYPLYTEILNTRSARLIGFNSAQPQLPTYFLAEKLAPELLKREPYSRGTYLWDSNVKPYQQFFKNYNSLPIMADFAEIGQPGAYFPFGADFVRGYARSRPEIREKFPDYIWQINKEPHRYSPLCLDTSKGWEILKTYYETGTRFMLESGANPFAYELFNEAEYQCRCKWAKAEFGRRMQAKYKDISQANKIWRTSFKKFEDIMEADKIEDFIKREGDITWDNVWQQAGKIARTEKFEDYNGLWIDWLKFSADRYIEILKKGKSIIQGIDTREDIYFLSQPHTYRSYLRHNGMDELEVAKAMDMVGFEAGMRFGFFEEPANQDDYLDLEPVRAGLEDAREEYLVRLDMAGSFGKPIANNELNIVRFYKGKRYPSKRTDLTTSLWEELIHGVSSDMIYTWHKWAFLWKTLEEAKNIVLHGPRYRASVLLNPYNYPPDSLLGIKDFTEEIAKLKDIVLPRPRIQGKIALVVSSPTVMEQSRKYGSVATNPYERWIINYYKSLLYANIPFDVIYEEQLENGSGIEGLGARSVFAYEAIIIPQAIQVYNETIRVLDRYLQQGGLVIATENTFDQDEYGNPLKEEIDSHKVTWISDGLYGRALQTKLLSLLTAYSIFRDYKLTDAETDRDYFGQIEIQLLDRGKTRLYYFCNWGDNAVLVRFHILDNLGGGDYQVIDPVSGAIVVQDNGQELWKASELKRGFLVSLASQVRKILLVSSDTRTITSLTTPGSRRINSQTTLAEYDKVTVAETREKEKNEKEFQEILDKEHAQIHIPREIKN